VNHNADALKAAGIDTALGLKSIGGKRERYESLLRKFAVRQRGSAEAIRSALSIGDKSTAEREAHSIKGAAGTLGAIALAEQAAKVETAIHAGQSVDEALESLALVLAAVVVAIHSAFPA
jgi:two-component system sensor histidine kinase/response regulator